MDDASLLDRWSPAPSVSPSQAIYSSTSETLEHGIADELSGRNAVISVEGLLTLSPPPLL